jgi:hypothetical protein
MKSSTATLLFSMIFCITTSAGAAQAPPVPHLTRTPGKPQIVFPLATRPGTNNGGIKDVIVGPTDNISAVANRLGVQAKSLNTLVTFAPGLVLTKPVTISIAYLTPFPAGNDRRTETYDKTKGNSFLYSDLEADGKLRKIHMDITLSEAKAGGGVVSYNVPLDFTLDPLYDVEFSSLIFTLITGCANVGANQIDLNWYSPETREKLNLNFQSVHFATKERETFNIREFSWSRKEVSATEDLRKVVVWYAENEWPIGFALVPNPSEENLVPGKTHRSDVGLTHSINESIVGGKCWATLDYTVTYQLRTFLGAPEVRDHR